MQLLSPPPPSPRNLTSCLHRELGGKAIWLALLIVFISSLSYSPNAKGEDCGPATVGCTWTTWTQVNSSPLNTDLCTTVYIPIDGLSVGCQVCFGYRYRWCGTTYEVEVNQYQIANPCYDYFKNIAINGTPAEKATWKSISESIWPYGHILAAKHFFKNYIRQGNSSYDCLGSTGCASGSGFAVVRSYSAECYEFLELTSSTGSPFAGTWRMACESSKCCIKTWQMCYDVSTGEVRTCNPTTTSYGFSTSCTGFSSFTAPDGCTIVHRTGCYSLSCPE
ncbi:MAG: hypothetical protein JST20_02345 [Bacteroidetes bacterium]|nr:hypothetical protein [Bacteroidota bacterium]